MRRSIALVSFVVLLALPLAGHAQEPFVLEALHLIHWEQVPDGRPSYTGPVSAAILMAWYAGRGYPELLPDLNHDGRIDPEDTILLARDFGEEMQANLIDDRLADPFLVYPLARYIAARYPGEFRMLLYDASFPEEVARDLGQPFDSREVPGILIEVDEDPRYETYREHLEAWRPGIVGIGFDVPEWNDFTVSRSFMFHEAPEGWPVDLVGTSGRFTPGPVWETLMQLSPERWGFLAPGWIPFEILIILLPADEELREPGPPGDDPGDGPGDGPGDDPSGDPGRDPGDDPGDEPGGGPGDGPGGGPGDDPKRYPGPGDGPGGEPRIPSGSDEEGVCCMPDGTCDTTTATDCAQRGGAFVVNETCATYVCPRIGEELCSKVEGEITDICYTYENGVLTVYASYAIHNRSNIAARDITAYAIVGLTDGVSGFGGPDGTDWRYGIDIPGGGTYAYDLVFTTSAPNLDLTKLSYLYGALWLQKEAPWDCWGILKQDFVQTWDPAPRCYPAGTPPGGSDDGGDPEVSSVCCLPDGSCMILNATDCDRVGGAYIASAADCASVDCGKILVGDCPKLSARIADICRVVAANGDVTIQLTVEIENTADVDAHDAELHVDAGWGFTGPNQTLYSGPTDVWTGTVPAGQTLTREFALDIGTAPDWATFHPWADAAAWMDDTPCDWRGDPVDSIAPDGSIPLCPPEFEPGSPPGGEEYVGACCFADGSCENLTSAECDRRGGEFYGEGTPCSSVDCEGGEPGGDPEPEPDPGPGAQPNLWVTGMTGCWAWSGGGQENVIATVTGVVHNGGQASASNVMARVTAGGYSQTVSVGTLAAGSQRSVSATIDIGPYDSVSWPVQTSITADPSGAIAEADESNNTTDSSFPETSDCN